MSVAQENLIRRESIYFQLAVSVPVWSKAGPPIMPHLTTSNQISCLINATEGLIIVMISSLASADPSRRTGASKDRLKAPTLLLSLLLFLPNTSFLQYFYSQENELLYFQSKNCDAPVEKTLRHMVILACGNNRKDFRRR